MRICLLQDALENFASNKHLVSTFLNQFASWQFEASESFEPEVSFLKQLQEEFADVTSSENPPGVLFFMQTAAAARNPLQKERLAK